MKCTRHILAALAAGFLVSTAMAGSSYTENFDNRENGAKATSIQGWSSGEQDESIVTNVMNGVALAQGNLLQINTNGDTLTNTLESAMTISTAADIYMDAMVQFVPSDDLTTPPADDTTKVALYALQRDDAQNATLVVYHSIMNGDGDIIQLSTDTGFPVSTNGLQHVVVTLKQFAGTYDVAAPFAFQVKVNNAVVTSTNAYTDAALQENYNGTYYKGAEGETEGSWFLTANSNSSVDANKSSLASLALSGTGYLDDLSFGTVDAPVVLDDTWTIEGFNAGGTWPLPTSVAADSKTLFYSNLVVNIDAKDSSIGRTIDAAWIGAKIIAPEAVTSETIANWKFDMSGAAGISFDASKDGQDAQTGLYYMYAWVPLTAAKVRTAIANQSDIAYAFDFYQDGGTATQTLALVISPKDIQITNTDDVEGAETIEVANWVENVPAPATDISVACVNGATYTEANGVYTFDAREGYTVSSVFTNGVSANTTTTLDLSAAEGEIKVVVAATKTRTAPEHKWWENPTVIGATSYGVGSSDTYYGPYNMDVDGDFITVPTWTSVSACLELYTRDAIDAGNASYLAKFARADYGYAMMGSGLSVPLNVAIAGANSGPHVVAFPLNNPNPVLGEDAFVISNSLNASLIQFKFTDDAQYVYARPYSGTVVYKFKVLNGLKTTGVNLVEPVTYEFGQRVRSFELAQIGGKDIVYALLEDKTISVVDTSVATPTPVQLISDVALSKYVNISVSGIADGTPHLTIASCTHTASRVDVYTLNAAGTAVDTSVEKMSFETAAITAWGVATGNADGADAVVVDDEGTLYLGYGSKVYAIQYVEPPVVTYAVDWTGSENVTAATNGTALVGTAGDFEADTVITFTPATDMVITNVAGVAVADLASYSLTVTEATNIVVLAGVSDDYAAGNTVGDTTISAAMAEWLNGKKNAAGKTKAAYTAAIAADTDSYTLADEYLLNTDPTVNTTVEFTISSITVGDTVDVQVSLTRSEDGSAVEAAINGTLVLQGATAVGGPYTPDQAANLSAAKFSGVTTATVNFTSTNKFFKAVITDKAVITE